MSSILSLASNLFYIWTIRLFGSSGCISGKCRKIAGKSQYPWKQAAVTGIYLAVFMIAAEKLVYRYFIMVGSHADVGKETFIRLQISAVSISRIILLVFIKLNILAWRMLWRSHHVNVGAPDMDETCPDPLLVLQYKVTFGDFVEVFCVPVITLALFTHFRTACGGKHFPTIVLLLYAVNILSSNLYRQERNGQIREVNVRTMRAEAEQYKAYSFSLGKVWQEFRKFRHDLKKQYMLECVYLENGQYELLHQEYEKALAVVVAKEVISGHVLIDAILSYKKREASERGIEITTWISVPIDLAINDHHLNILLGNILDNAVKYTIRGGKIGIKILYDRSNLMIVCRNTIKEMTVNSIQISGPVGGAEKQIPGLRNGQVERNPHGLGLQIVQEVVAFYNGTFEIKKSEFEYVVRAFLELQYQKLH